MKFLPFDSFSIKTTLPLYEIKERIERHVEPKKLFRFLTREKYFEGQVTDEGFTISRVILYRNSFLPKITGIFKENIDGVEVEVKMSMHTPVIIFMAIWMGGMGFGAFASISTLISCQGKFHPMLLIPIGMLFFGWGLVSFGFWPEAHKAKELLNKIFTAGSKQNA